MDEDQNIPLLFSFYFGDSAASAQKGASRRLKKWSRAFDQWIDERKQHYQKNAVKQARMAWRRFVRQCGKIPWQITREDIEQHSAWMNQEGFARSTINPTIGIIAGFYRWCDAHQVDPACPPGFNPAKEASRIKYKYYEGACIWAREEVRAFLDLLSRDGSELGKREYAYFLARINLGVKLKVLQQLKWEQLEVDEPGAWVRWRLDGERVKLPDEVWQAIKEYLRVSGRLEGIRAGKVIFAPLSRPSSGITGGKDEDWLEQQQLSYSAILANLKIYGRKLGIAEDKLTFMALRRTAIRLKLEDGESWVGMKAFMDSRVDLTQMKSRLGRLPELPGESTLDADLPTGEVQPPVRRAHRLNGVEHTTHGFFCRKRDTEGVRAVLRENIHGMEAEIASLRKLMRGLVEREGDEARLAEAYSKAAQRLGLLVSSNEPVRKENKDPWAEEMLNILDQIERSNGRPPVSPQVREQAYGISTEGMEARGLVAEEVATCRLLLRNVFRRLMQGIGADEYVRLVDLYGMGCVRLARLLKIGGCNGDDRLEQYLQSSIDEAIRQLNQEWEREKLLP